MTLYKNLSEDFARHDGSMDYVISVDSNTAETPGVPIEKHYNIRAFHNTDITVPQTMLDLGFENVLHWDGLDMDFLSNRRSLEERLRRERAVGDIDLELQIEGDTMEQLDFITLGTGNEQWSVSDTNTYPLGNPANDWVGKDPNDVYFNYANVLSININPDITKVITSQYNDDILTDFEEEGKTYMIELLLPYLPTSSAASQLDLNNSYIDFTSGDLSYTAQTIVASPAQVGATVLYAQPESFDLFPDSGSALVAGSLNVSYSGKSFDPPRFVGCTGITSTVNQGTSIVTLNPKDTAKIPFSASTDNLATPSGQGNIMPITLLNSGPAAVTFAGGEATVGTTSLLEAPAMGVTTPIVSSNQGFVAMQFRPQWLSTSSAQTKWSLWSWSDGINNMELFYNASDDKFKFDAGNQTVSSAAQSFASNVTKTVAVYWNGTTAAISIDGGAFVTTSRTPIPTISFGTGAHQRIGNTYNSTATGANAKFTWVMTGTGILTNANALAFVSFDPNSPNLPSQPGNPTLFWNADSLSAVYVSYGRHATFRINRDVLGDTIDLRNLTGIRFRLKALNDAMVFKAQNMVLYEQGAYNFPDVEADTKRYTFHRAPSRTTTIAFPTTPERKFIFPQTRPENFTEVIGFNSGHPAPSGQDNLIYLYARYIDDNNYIRISLRSRTTQTRITITEFVNGVSTILFQTPTNTNILAPETDYYFKVEAEEYKVRATVYRANGVFLSGPITTLDAQLDLRTSVPSVIPARVVRDFPTSGQFSLQGKTISYTGLDLTTNANAFTGCTGSLGGIYATGTKITSTNHSIFTTDWQQVHYAGRGHFGFAVAPYYHDFNLDFVRNQNAEFARFESKPFISMTPVHGAAIKTNTSPPIDLMADSTLSAVGDGIATADLSFGNPPPSVKIVRDGSHWYGGYGTDDFIFMGNPKHVTIVGDIHPNQSFTGEFRVMLVDRANSVVFIDSIEGVLPNRWNRFELPILLDKIAPVSLRVLLVQVGLLGAEETFYLDNFAVHHDSIGWDASADNGLHYQPFLSAINDIHKGVNFQYRGVDLRVRARAFSDTAWINGYQVIPKYGLRALVPSARNSTTGAFLISGAQRYTLSLEESIRPIDNSFDLPVVLA
jgi:hypothetical protein